MFNNLHYLLFYFSYIFLLFFAFFTIFCLFLLFLIFNLVLDSLFLFHIIIAWHVFFYCIFSFMFVFIVLLFLYSYYLFLLFVSFSFLLCFLDFLLVLLNIIQLFTIHQTNWNASNHIDSIIKRKYVGICFDSLCFLSVSFLFIYPLNSFTISILANNNRINHVHRFETTIQILPIIVK